VPKFPHIRERGRFMNKPDNRGNDLPQETKDSHSENFKDIVGFAHEEIIFVRSAYRWLISLVGIFIIIVGTLIGILTYKSINNLKKEAREEVERQVEILGKQVNKRIDEEYNKENIHNLVEDKAKERIDKIADGIIEKKIDDKVFPKIRLAQEQLENVENNIKELKQRNKIAQLGDRAVLKASRDSLEELERMEKEAKNEDLKAAIGAEIARIKMFWISVSWTKERIIKLDGKEIRGSDIKTNILIDEMLTNNDWVLRAMVAQ
jgi:hypothetical protein